jgi:hypothetical protein
MHGGRPSLRARIARGIVVFGAGLTLVGISVFSLMGMAAQAATTESAVTQLWNVEQMGSSSPNASALNNLVVTVGQTEHLGHQGIDVTWSGAIATSPAQYGTNFLQIMQCWGDLGSPTPDQCQFGAPVKIVQDLAGDAVVTRSVSSADPQFDPSMHPELQVPGQPAGSAYAYPFSSVRGDTTFDTQNYFTSATTNEVSAARTGNDGTGRVTFEVQTTLEAPHLGCGAEVSQLDGSTYPRPCWLVIVPRGDKNPDGTDTSTSLPPRISGSPFSPTNWADRLVFPLNFDSVSQSCALGQAERRVVGSEVIADAFTSWQPGLCGSGTTYGFSLIGDSEARAQIVSDVSGASRLAFISEPLSTVERKGNKIIYAPVAQSAIVFGYNIDYNVLSNATADVVAKNGTRLSNLVLNQRIVAKLLTQSYRVDNPGLGVGDAVLEANPFSVTTDPEFINLNPDFDKWNTSYPQGLLVALGTADAYRHVWQWIRSSPDAVAFLNGTPDDDGMRINPEYVSLGLGTGEPATSFPKTDLTTFIGSSGYGEPGYGTLDMRPYYNDMQETAYRTLRADGNVKTFWNTGKTPFSYSALPPQAAGERLMISITDASAASRYGLDVAALVNANGDHVLPTTDSITAAISTFTPSDAPGVKRANPATTASGAYPLAEVIYAATNICGVDDALGADYARILTYAAGDGQIPGSTRGMLPLGYVPLTSDFVAQTLAASSAIAAPGSLQADCPGTVSLSSRPSRSSGSSSSAPVAPALTTTPSPTARPSVGATTDHVGLDTAVAGIGLAAGLPLCVAGPLMVRQSRRKTERV